MLPCFSSVYPVVLTRGRLCACSPLILRIRVQTLRVSVYELLDDRKLRQLSFSLTARRLTKCLRPNKWYKVIGRGVPTQDTPRFVLGRLRPPTVPDLAGPPWVARSTGVLWNRVVDGIVDMRRVEFGGFHLRIGVLWKCGLVKMFLYMPSTLL